MTEAEIYVALTEVFHEAFGDDAIVLKPETSAKDIAGWNSMKMVLIIIAVEQRFAIKLKSREIDKLNCVADLAGVISNKTT